MNWQAIIAGIIVVLAAVGLYRSLRHKTTSPNTPRSLRSSDCCSQSSSGTPSPDSKTAAHTSSDGALAPRSGSHSSHRCDTSILDSCANCPLSSRCHPH